MQAPHAHKTHLQGPVRIGVLTVSDTRTEEFDVGGNLAVELFSAAGHTCSKQIVRDVPSEIQHAVRGLFDGGADIVFTTGGTGIAPRDCTIEAIEPLLVKKIDGFGELFRMMSSQEIGAAAMLSRALAGTVGTKLVFALPGSPAAVRLGIEKLILPELGHMLGLLGRA